MTEYRAGDLENQPAADEFAVVRLPEFDVVRVLCDLDIATVGAFSEAIHGSTSEGRPVIVDFSACAYMDSTGLRVTATEYGKLPRGSRIIVPDGGTVRRLFVITGFDSALSPASTLDQALREAGTVDEPEPYG